MKSEISHTLQNGQIITGVAHSKAQLSAKFQIWARQHGLSDAESLACWIADDDRKKILYFESAEDANKLAASGFEKIH